MKYLSYLLGSFSAAAAIGYFVVYLSRWEWQRALISGILLLVIEIFLAGVVLLSRIARMEKQLTDHQSRTEEVLRRLELAREEGGNRFKWLDGQRPDGTHRTFVFVPVLMAAGAVLSFIAWLVQKIATATARPGAERRLAGRLSALSAPPGVEGAELEHRPAVPRARSVRTAVFSSAALAGLLAAGFFVSNLADATQTRADTEPRSAATTVVFQVQTRPGTEGPARELAAQELWESCRRSTRVVPGNAALGRLGEDVWAGVVRPGLSKHDLMRLHGCLKDATANRVSARVLGEGHAG